MNNQCIVCKEVLITKDEAKDHYRAKHPCHYVMIYEGESLVASMNDPEFLKLAASYAMCTKCKTIETACKFCKPLFEAASKT